MMKNKFVILLCLLGTIVFSGCGKEEKLIDGDWPPIELTVNGIKYESHTLLVPPEGGEYKVNSSNYGPLWLIGLYENSNMIECDFGWDIHITKEWYEIQYDKDKNIVINISPKAESTEPRSIYVDLEFGDAFSGIIFMQE